MSPDRSAPALLRAVGLMADGPVVWGRPIPASRPGVFVIELAAPRASAPLELTKTGKWLERVETLRLDGERPSSRQLAARLAAFWLPSDVVLYVGATPVSIAGRVRSLRETVLGDRRPHAGGHWLHALTGLETARIWWTVTDAVEEYEDALLTAFAAGVAAEERAALHDPEVVLPFANLRTPTGVRKQTGLTGSIIVEPVVATPPTHVVDVPDGAAEGALFDAPAPGGGVRRAGAAPRAASGAAPRSASGAAPRRAAPRATGGPRAPSKASIARAGRLAEPIHLTTDGVARLTEELRVLVDVQRPQVIARIRTAKELGDLKENADYTSAREEQSFLEGRIQSIEAQLRDAQIIEVPAAGSRIGLGSSVTVETLGEETTYVLVGSTEADPAQGRISVASPVGRALLGHGPGDEIVIRTPRGEATYRVLGVG